MERSKSNAVNLTLNGTLNATTSSTPANLPRDGSSSESRDGSIQGVQATRQELGHNDSASVEIERSRSNADNGSFNETLDATTDSTPANTPRDGSSIERWEIGGSIPDLEENDLASLEEVAEYVFNGEDVNHCSHGEFCLFCPPISRWTSTSLLEDNHAFIYGNTSSGETSADAFYPYTQTNPENEGVLGEAEVDMPDSIHQSRAFDVALFALYDYMNFDYAQVEAKDPDLCINIYKYEAANSTCPDSKEHCCICLDEYFDGEELAKIDCGHLYHVGCIKEWNKIENTCPLCKRKVLAMLP